MHYKSVYYIFFLHSPIILSYFPFLLKESQIFSNNISNYIFTFSDFIFPFIFLLLLILFSSVSFYFSFNKKKFLSINKFNLLENKFFFFLYLSLLSLIFNLFYLIEVFIIFKQIFIQIGFITSLLIFYFIILEKKNFILLSTLVLIFFLEICSTVLISGTTREVFTKLFIIFFATLLKKKKIYMIYLFPFVFIILFLKNYIRDYSYVKYNLSPVEYAKKYIDNETIQQFKKNYQLDFKDGIDELKIKEYTDKLNISVVYYNYAEINLFAKKINQYQEIYYPSICDPVDDQCLTFSEFFKRLYESKNDIVDTNNYLKKFSFSEKILQRFNKLPSLLFYFKYAHSDEYSALTPKDFLKNSLFAIPIPRLFWENKPTSNKGIELGDNFGFNNYKTGKTAWYEPSYIELFIYFKSYGLIFFILFYGILFFFIGNLINNLTNTKKLIILFSLLKLLIDLSQDGFIEGCYSFLLLASTLLLFNFVAHKLKLTKNLT
jgi:hypothetical protein